MKQKKNKKENSQNDIRVETKTKLNNLGNTANLKLWSKWKSISRKSKWTYSSPDILETVVIPVFSEFNVNWNPDPPPPPRSTSSAYKTSPTCIPVP